MNPSQTIERFIVDELLMGQRNSLDPDEPLMSTGLLDSVSFLRLVGYLEERFGVTVESEELVPDNFETLDAMTQLLASKSVGPEGVAATN